MGAHTRRYELSTCMCNVPFSFSQDVLISITSVRYRLYLSMVGKYRQFREIQGSFKITSPEAHSKDFFLQESGN